ncbi:MAG: hypothetical protein FWF51_12055 [Chitinivibrionia bacterium]|nr:hypothetical protein [Chitinivibrionia bacterium]
MEEKTAKGDETQTAQELTAEDLVKEKLVENFTNVKKYVLINPVKVMDKYITELNLDFDNLKGRENAK